MDNLTISMDPQGLSVSIYILVYTHLSLKTNYRKFHVNIYYNVYILTFDTC